MAMFHVHAMVVHKTHTNPGAAGLSQYLKGGAGDLRRYMERADPGREDLVAYGEAGLPSWAHNGTHFFAMANQYEARKDAVIARHFQVTLPRELSEPARHALADDIRDAFFARYPHAWAMHNPPARDDSGEQPHLHVLMSPRRDDGVARTPKRWFAGLGHDADHPEDRRVPIDRTWEQKRTLRGLRHETAVLINAALEREGVSAAVSPDRLRGQGHGRAGVHYHQHGTQDEIALVKTQQAALRAQGVQDIEQAINVVAWHQQKAREGITDISREAIVDHVRDRFWLYDRSPAREFEREASLVRTLEREWARTGRTRTRAQNHEERTRSHSRSREDDRMHEGLHVRHVEPSWEQTP
jgi:MobA/MobL family